MQGSQDTLDVATILELIDDRVRRRGNSGNDGDGKKGREFGASFEVRVSSRNVEKRYTSPSLFTVLLL